MMLDLVLATLLTSQPLAIRVEVAELGKGSQGTVMGVAIQVAPEDRGRAGERVQVELSLLHGGVVADTQSAVVPLAGDGSAMLYREWTPGEGELRVTIASLDGSARGGWSGRVVVPVAEKAFEPGVDAPPDALAVGAAPPASEGVRFLPPPRPGGIGALQLEVETPSRTARVDFLRDGELLVTRNRAPWTVSIDLGEQPRRTAVQAVAYARDGAFLGEDALVLNGPANQLPVEILLGPEPAQSGAERTVTVAVGRAPVVEVSLRADGKSLAHWVECPCVAQVPAEVIAHAKVLSAEVLGRGGERGQGARILGGSGFVDEVRVEEVELPVVVLDGEGKLITDLPKEAFRVREDGQEVALDSFGTTNELPLNLGIAVDISGSMEKPFPEVREAVGGFAGSLLRAGDRFFVITFSFEPKVEVEWSSDARLIGTALERITPEGGTSLYDAVVRALEQFRSRRGRTALVLLTDGDDTTSRTGWDVALRFCRTARIPIFPLGFRIGALDFITRDRLKQTAVATGGEAFFAPRGDALRDVYRKISDQLRAQYLLAYRSPSRKGAEEFRSINVEVLRQGLKARTIAGYYPGW